MDKHLSYEKSSGFDHVHDPPPTYTDEDAAIILGKFPPPPPSCRPLALPVSLPQIVSSYDAPFARAYNPVLAESGIEQADWLRFLDGLNIAITASPPLRVVDMAGLVIGFVPYHWALIAGIVMQTASQTAMHIISKTLTDRYLRKANAEFFGPRGLKVRLMKTAAMRKFIHIDADDPNSQSPSKAKEIAKSIGRTAESVVLRLPIPFVGRVLSMIPDAAPKIDPDAPQDITHRRLDALDGYILPVSTLVPAPETPTGLMDKASALAIKLRQWRSRKSESKAARQRRLLAIAEGHETPASAFAFAGSANTMTRRQARRAERSTRKRHGGAHVRRLKGKVAKADRLEYITTDMLVWLVLFNADQDSEIEGTNLADNTADVEHIRDDDWKEVLEKEDDEEIEEINSE